MLQLQVLFFWTFSVAIEYKNSLWVYTWVNLVQKLISFKIFLLDHLFDLLLYLELLEKFLLSWVRFGRRHSLAPVQIFSKRVWLSLCYVAGWHYVFYYTLIRLAGFCIQRVVIAALYLLLSASLDKFWCWVFKCYAFLGSATQFFRTIRIGWVGNGILENASRRYKATQLARDLTLYACKNLLGISNARWEPTHRL